MFGSCREIINETECVRFAKKFEDFQKFLKFFCRINKSHQNIVYIGVWKGQ